MIDCILVVQEVGDEHPFCCSEAADPIASEVEVEVEADKTDVGDLLSCSQTSWLGDGDLSDWDDGDIDIPLSQSTDLRGYGCIGFLFGRGGGISTCLTEPSKPPFDSRTT